MFGALPLLAITMGLLSSLHCIGMCGPIALALPVRTGGTRQKLFALGVYNTGRTLTYASLGAAIGVLGSGLAWMGFLKYLSVLAGVAMLAYVLWPAHLNRYLHLPTFWQQIVKKIKQKMSVRLKRQGLASWLILGTLNGALPCGMVSLALVSSLATGTASGGALYMLLFGVGTVPTMMAVGFFKQFISTVWRIRIHRFTPVLVGIAGVLLVIRGIVINPSHTEEHAITVCAGK
jgi:uncharacterized protein